MAKRNLSKGNASIDPEDCWNEELEETVLDNSHSVAVATKIVDYLFENSFNVMRMK